jgi:hypothetical protein
MTSVNEGSAARRSSSALLSDVRRYAIHSWLGLRMKDSADVRVRYGYRRLCVLSRHRKTGHARIAQRCVCDEHPVRCVRIYQFAPLQCRASQDRLHRLIVTTCETGLDPSSGLGSELPVTDQPCRPEPYPLPTTRGSRSSSRALALLSATARLAPETHQCFAKSCRAELHLYSAPS